MEQAYDGNDSLHIRVATEADTSVVLEFIKGLAEYERLPHEVTATEALIKKNVFGRRNAEVILAEIDGKPVGFALFFHNFSTFLGKPGIYLEDLFVKPEYRKRGIGKQLLIYLARLAKERDCGRFEWAVLNWNESAISFYESLGAKPMDEWTVYRLAGESLDKVAAAEVGRAGTPSTRR